MKLFKKIPSKLLAVAVVLTMLLALVPASAFAVTGPINVIVRIYDAQDTDSNGTYETTREILAPKQYSVSQGTISAGGRMGLSNAITTTGVKAINALYAASADVAGLGTCVTQVNGSSAYISQFNGLSEFAAGANSGWMYFVNDQYIPEGIGTKDLADNDVVTLFYATDYKTSLYSYYDKGTLTLTNNKIVAQTNGSGDGGAVALKVMGQSLNFSDLYATALNVSSGAGLYNATGGIEYDQGFVNAKLTASITTSTAAGLKTAYTGGVQYIPAYYPFSTAALGYATLAAADSALTTLKNGYTGLTAANYYSGSWTNLTDAYTEANALLANGSRTIGDDIGAINYYAKMYADLISANDPKINRLGIGTYGLEFGQPVAPTTYAYTFDNGTATTEVFQLGYINPGASCSPSITGGGSVSYDGGTKRVTVSSLSATTGTYVITLAVTCGIGSQNYTITINKSSNGSPDAVSAYLPAPGQFATGTGWGSISTDDANSLSNPATVKLLANPSGTGVSLGGLGGYVIMRYNDGIENSNRHKYGVDFIVYGNAFSGWCEPGAVMVATDADENGVPDQWYYIAGSEHYSTTAAWPTDVQYDKDASDIDITINGGARTTWTTAMAAWPDYRTKAAGGDNYGNTANSSLSPGVTYTSGNSQVIFNDIVKLADNPAYQFGYGDVHPNGSSFGTQTNPYTEAAGTSYGDGIDIDWAVDMTTGEPVHLDKIYFVKVYTAVSKNQPPFGEVSTEVLGAKATSLEASGVGTTAAPTITLTIGGTPYDLAAIADDPSEIKDMGTVTVSTGAASVNLGVTSAGSTVFINNEALTSKSITGIPSGSYKSVRVIAQSGNAQPYVILLKLTW